MEHNKNYKTYQRSSYVHGSAARSYEQLPERMPVQPLPKRESKNERNERIYQQNQERKIKEAIATKMNFGTFVLVLIAVVATFYVCFTYIQLHGAD